MNLCKLIFLAILTFGCASAPSLSQQAATQAQLQAGPRDLSSFFKDTIGCFVLYDLRQNRYTRHNEARSRERFSPKSTFKIPNSLIGLQSGVIRDADFVIQWDRQKYPPDGWDTEPFVNWKRDHTLRTAFKHSVVWYYRESALRVGPERMKQSVTAFDYGNRDTSGPVNQFWLNETLKISADEQVEFLKKLYFGQLPVSPHALSAVKEIMVQEQTPKYKLSAKTGGGPRAEGVVIGWYVGYVETGDNVYFFAMNIDGPSYLAIRDKRIEMTKQILGSLGVLPR